MKARFQIVYLELTNACNFTCDYCPIDRQTRKKVTMPAEFACEIIDQIADNNLTNYITFHLMGEPFLHKQLCQLTGYAEAKGLRVRLLTNGSLLESKRNQDLFANNLTRLEVGFRTPNDTSFSMRLRGGRLTLDEYIRRTKELIEDRIRRDAATVVCIKLFIRSFAAAVHLGDSYEHLTSREDNLNLALDLQRHTLQIARKYGRSTAEWETPVRIIDGEYPIFPGIHLAFSRIQDFWVREQRGEDASKGYPAWFGGCSAGFRDDFGILATGEVTTCCVDYDGKNVIGDLRKQPLMEVLESAEARRIEKSFRMFRPPTQFCRDCLGGPTLSSSLVKQISSIGVDMRDRLRSRKNQSRVIDRQELSSRPALNPIAIRQEIRAREESELKAAKAWGTHKPAADPLVTISNSAPSGDL